MPIKPKVERENHTHQYIDGYYEFKNMVETAIIVDVESCRKLELHLLPEKSEFYIKGWEQAKTDNPL